MPHRRVRGALQTCPNGEGDFYEPACFFVQGTTFMTGLCKLLEGGADALVPALEAGKVFG